MRLIEYLKKIISFLTETNNTFENKKSYEKVIAVLRQHWFILFIQIFVHTTVLFMVGILIFITMVYFNTAAITYLLFFVSSLILLIWWSKLFYIITMYLLDVWVITDHRIIDSRQCGFFCRDLSEINLGKIQDIETTIVGFIATYLDFGDVKVQSAGTQQKINLLQVANPHDIKEKITHCQSDFSNVHAGGIEIHEQTASV